MQEPETNNEILPPRVPPIEELKKCYNIQENTKTLVRIDSQVKKRGFLKKEKYLKKYKHLSFIIIIDNSTNDFETG